MRPPTEPAPGSHDDVLRRRIEALREPPQHPAYAPSAGSPGSPPGSSRGDALLLPVPGRHVSRRAAPEPRVAGRAVAGAVAGVVPAPLRGRVGLGGAQLAVLALVVAVSLSVTAWWVLRADARTVEAPAPAAGLEPTADLVALPPVAGPTGPGEPTAVPEEVTQVGPGTGGATPVATEEVTVDVAGQVRRAGVVTLPAGSRVVDALERAGGSRPGVDLSALNLARVLVDGEQVVVGPVASGGVPAGATIPAAPAVPADPAAPVGVVDLNTADELALEALPEVGPVTAAAIVSWREENGGFTAVEELLEVDGIGEVTLAQIAPHATV